MKYGKLIFITLFLAVYILSCKKDDLGGKPSYSLGQNYGGGVIFYIDGTGEHGLIAAPFDQSSSARWYNGVYVTTNTNDGSVGKGKSNTNEIINSQGSGVYAAMICDQLELNGYNDWFLPSKNELNLMYQQRNIIGGFANDYYWSSPEYNTNLAWNQYFPYGAQYYADKSSLAHVRAIRAF